MENLQNEDKLGQAFKLWMLAKMRQIKDWQFTETAEKTKRELEEKMGDIIEKYPELEEFLPYPIEWR